MLLSLLPFLLSVISTTLAAPLAHPQVEPVANAREEVNPWKPDRTSNYTPPASTQVAGGNDHFKTYHFAVRDFFIILGGVFLAVGFLIGVLLVWRKIWGKKQDFEAMTKSLASAPTTTIPSTATGRPVALAASTQRS
ncbi:hypothetical protein HK102_001083 [Quaeritorhiza haematococci]|nr:hypothetical protein HK102_001083 [Quaeritorhiza haematococci]